MPTGNFPGWQLHLGLFGYLERVVNVNPEVADGAFRDDLLSPPAVAQVQRELQTMIRQSTSERRSDRDRVADKDAEIARLVEAIARVGHSNALEARLRSAETERDELQHTATAPTARAVPSPEDVAAAYRRVVLDLQECLKGDVVRAREALQKLLGEIRVVAEGGEVYAEVETRADSLLLDAVGAGVSNLGCGGVRLHY